VLNIYIFNVAFSENLNYEKDFFKGLDSNPNLKHLYENFDVEIKSDFEQELDKFKLKMIN
jgi:hypothetical protein